MRICVESPTKTPSPLLGNPHGVMYRQSADNIDQSVV